MVFAIPNGVHVTICTVNMSNTRLVVWNDFLGCVNVYLHVRVQVLYGCHDYMAIVCYIVRMCLIVCICVQLVIAFREIARSIGY